MTAKARVLILPLLAIAVVFIVAAAFYVFIACAVDGRESPGDKHECSILQSFEAKHKDVAAGLQFFQDDEYYIVSVRQSATANPIWIMLNPRNPPFYKQLPPDNYSLSEDQYDRIITTRHATSTVEDVLQSHIR